tara:strand:+ start:555 stop:707 length:153 start_codon:yes stop_codon:yes gene_type:complete
MRRGNVAELVSQLALGVADERFEVLHLETNFVNHFEVGAQMMTALAFSRV